MWRKHTRSAAVMARAPSGFTLSVLSLGAVPKHGKVDMKQVGYENGRTFLAVERALPNVPAILHAGPRDFFHRLVRFGDGVLNVHAGSRHS